MIIDRDRLNNLEQQRAHYLREHYYAIERSDFYASIDDTRKKYYWAALARKAKFEADKCLHEIRTGKKDNRKFEDYE